MSSNVNKSIAIGAAWMIGLRQLDRVIGLISITILARLLLPDAFGLIAYAMTFFAIIELFFQFGFETVLIRDQDAGPDSYNTAWTLELIKGVALSMLLCAGAIPISLFFNEPRVENIIYVLAATPLLQGLKNIGVVDFQKKMKFDKEFIYKFVPRVLSVVVTIFLAFKLRNHWALVFGMLTNSALGLILSYVMSPYRPKLCLSKFSRVFGFSKWLLVQNVIRGLNDRLPVLIIGRYFESRVVAFYNMGFELSNLASGEFAAPIRRALFPGVASIADDEQKMVNTIISAIGIIALIGLPATIGIAVTAPIFVPVLLGGNWNEIVPVIQILAINGVALILYSNSHIIFYSANRPILTAYMSGLRLLLLAPGMLVLVPKYGALGAAWALSIANVVVTIIEYFQLHRMVNIRAVAILSVIWRSIIGVIIMAFTTHYFMRLLNGLDVELALVLQLILVAGVGAITYAVVVLTLWLISGKPDGAEAYVMRTLQGMRRKAKPDNG